MAAAGGCAAQTATTSVTITALPVATFSYTGTPYCQNAANPSPTFSGGGVAGTFSSTAGLVFVSTATGQVNLSASTPGTYTVTNTIAASGGCAAVTASSSITITALPVATFSYTGTPYCQNAANPSPTFSGGGVAGTFSSTAGLVFVSTATGQINLSASTPGTYTVTNTIAAAGGCAAVTATSSITITTLPAATISYAGSPFCSSLVGAQAVTQTGSAGGTYSSTAGLTINAATGAITPSASTAGTYTVTYTMAAAGGCAAQTATTSVTITTLPAATISYAGSPFCSSLVGAQAVTQTGTAGGTYSSTAGLTINAATGAITPSSSTAGTYTVTYTMAAAGGCAAQTATTSVTITTLPAATISYAGSPFCSSLVGAQAVTQTGTAGGTYSSTAGLTINAATGAITPSSSTAGTYTVTYTMAAAGGCAAQTATTSVTITTLPIATFNYTGTPYCQNAANPSPTFSGGGVAGTFSSTAGLVFVSTATGQINLSASTAGTYTVTNTIAAASGCAAVTATSSITITALPVATFNYTGTPYCQNAANPSPTFSGGGVAGTFSSTAGLVFVSTATGQVNLSASTAGTYTVTNTIAAASGCAAVTATSSITITTLPAATISYAGSPFCSSLVGAQAVTQTGTAGGTYSSTAGLTINAATGAITPSTSTAGTYTVTYTMAAAGGCAAQTATTSVTITALPVGTFSYTGTPYCQNAANPSPTFSGGGVAGTFSSTAGLVFVSTATGQINLSASTAGTYTVTNTIAAASGCAAVTASSSITITALPVATFSYTGTPYCQNAANPSPTFSGGGVAGTFSSTAGLVFVSTATGQVNLSASTAGTYTVTNTIAAAGGCAAVTATSSITITTLPAATISYAGSPFCSSLVGAQAVTQTGTAGGTYSSTAGLTINAATGAITPSTSTAGTYTVTYTMAAAGGCAAQTATTSVTITTLPAATISYAGSPFCSSLVGAQSVTQTGTAGGTYSSTAGLTINAATGAITPSSSTAGTYTVTYTMAAAAGCAAQTATTSVTITALPVATFSYTGTPYCQNAANPSPTFSGGGVAGTFSSTAGLVFVSTSTGQVNLSASTPGTYTVTNTIAATSGCAAVTATSSITITTLPAATISYAGSPFCSSLVGTQAVTQTGTAGGTYSSTAGLTINAATGAITPSTSTAGTYTVTYTMAAAGGCAAQTATTSVTITTLPAATISYAGTPFCKTLVGAQAVTQAGTAGGTYSSTAGLTINAATGAITPSSSTAGTYTVTYTMAAAAGCTVQTATTSVTITALPVATFSYTGTPYCQNAANPSPTFSGGGVAGTFSSTAGLVFVSTATGQVDLSASTPGTYTVTNTIAAASGCAAVTASSSITITALPVATFSYTGTPYCQNAANPSPTFSGGGVAGTFSSTAGLVFVSTATGQVNLSASTAGTYTVTNTIAAANGCAVVTATSSITITALPVATFSYTGTPYCQNAANPSPTFSGGGVAGTFSSTAGLVFVSTATGQINLSASTAGTYTVTNTIAASGGCAAVTATSSVTITALPVATFSYTGTPYCQNAANPNPTFSGGGVAGTFSSTAGLVFVSTATGQINLSASTPGTYTVTNTIAASGGCAAVTATSSITITALPVATFSYTGTPYCQNAANPSPTFSGGGVAGTFSSTAGLVFVSTATGQVDLAASIPGTYTVTNTIASSGGCAAVTATSSIAITTLPAATISYAGSPFCSSLVGAQSVTQTGTAGGTYSSTAGLTINAATGAITPSSSTAGTYTVTYTMAAAAGCAAQTATTSVTITALPVATFSYAGTPYCQNAANPGPTFSGGGVAGTFSSTAGLVFVSTATGQVDLSASTPGTYTVTNTIAAASGCAAVTATSSITITSLPIATFSYTGTPYCQNASNPSPTFSGGGVAGTFSSTAGLVFVSTATGQVDLVASIPGTYTVTNTIASSGGCAAVTATSSVTITSLPIATFSYTGTPYCQNAANPSPTFSGGGVSGTFSSTAGLVFVSTATGQVNLSASTPGTYTVTNTIAPSSGCAAVTATSSITITALPVATFSFAGTPYCQNAANPSPTFSGGGIAGTFSSTAGLVFVSTATGQVNLSASTPGTYTVTNTIAAASGCAAVTATSSITITTLPAAAISYAGSPFCSSLVGAQSITQTGTTGGTYSSTAGLTINAATGAITPSSSTAGTYTVTYTMAAVGGCAAQTATTSVTITALPVATFSYTGTPYCQNAANPGPTFSGGGVAGTFSSTAGLVFVSTVTGQVDLAASTPGTYTVTNTIAAAGGCAAQTATTSVTITALPVATFSYAGTPYCQNAANPSPTFSGGGVAGTFSSTAGLVFVSTATGQVNLSASTPATYTVTNTIASSGGCAAVTATSSIIITALPAATFSYTGTPYCQNASNPSPTFSGGGVAGTFSSTAGLVFVSTATGQVNLSASTPGTYTVTNTIAASGGCAAVTATSSVTITALPVATFSYTGTPYCQNAANPSPTFSGGGVAGTFSSTAGLVFVSTATGQVNLSASTPGTYTVTNTIAAASGCAAVTATSSITITTLPAATISYAGSPFCSSLVGAQSITQTGTTGGTYSSTAGLTINAATGAITPSSSTAGTYTVTYTMAAVGGCAAQTATTSVTITALPVATFSYTGTPYCQNAANPSPTFSGGGVAGTFSSTAGLVFVSTATGQVNLSASTPGTYTVTNTIAPSSGCAAVTATSSITITALPVATFSFAGTPYCQNAANPSPTFSGGGIAGTFSSTAGLVFVSTATGQVNLSASTAGTYTVTNTIAAASGCAAVTATSSITIATSPAATLNYAGSPYCATGTATVTQTGTAGGTYTAPAGVVINAATGDIDLVASTPGTYTITYSFTSGGCSNTTTTSITINALPTATINYAGSPYCAGGAATVTQTGQAGGTYTAPAGVVINASTGDIDLATSAGGTYNITYSFTNGTCSDIATTSVTINAVPLATIAYAGSPYCATGTATVTQTGQAGGTYSSTIGLSINSATGSIDLVGSTAGTYTVTYSFGSGICSNTTTASITITALPVATIAYSASPYCATGTATVTQAGTAGGTYTAPAGVVINAVTGDIDLVTSTPGTYTITYSFTSGTCSNTTTASITITALPTATIAYTGCPYCATGTATVTQTGTVGGTYTAPAGVTIDAVTGDIDLVASTPGTYTITYSFTSGGCSNTTTASITITALPIATIAYTGSPYCATGTATVTLTGTAGGTYTAPAGVVIDAATGDIDLVQVHLEHILLLIHLLQEHVVIQQQPVSQSMLFQRLL